MPLSGLLALIETLDHDQREEFQWGSLFGSYGQAPRPFYEGIQVPSAVKSSYRNVAPELKYLIFTLKVTS